ncbi:MAG: lipoyl(octanoyl) transferase LipB [Gammaproteobacteria bacterium]|jgi:lipoyl(octanoyl) transferase|nr:lipoyl(octanoyl) transferase LipB [Gammaproteobacteria bacterium]
MKAVFHGRQEYVPMWQKMQEFTNTRDDKTPDEIWFVEHLPVFTMGLNASEEHLLEPGDIPVIKTDRGGQVTFHGPGQLMIYPLINLRRSNMGVRALVTALEQSAVNLAADYDVEAVAHPDAPGVYVNGEKLASLGLRIRRGSSFHGMALNIAIDLEPFTRINPCGYAELQMTDLHRLGINLSLEDAADKFLPHLLNQLPL